MIKVRVNEKYSRIITAYLDATTNRFCTTLVDGDSTVNRFLVLDTGAKALARTETPTENVNTNARKPDFIIIVNILPVTKEGVMV